MAAHHAKIILPVEQEVFEGSLVNSVPLQSVLPDLTRQIAYHLPSHKLLQMVKLPLRPQSSQLPVQGPPSSLMGQAKQGKPLLSGRISLVGNGWKVMREALLRFLS